MACIFTRDTLTILSRNIFFLIFADRVLIHNFKYITLFNIVAMITHSHIGNYKFPCLFY